MTSTPSPAPAPPPAPAPGVDLFSEDALTLEQAARLLPGRPSVRSVNRWCIEGVAGERLAHTRIGCKIITTRSALTDFARRVSERYHDPRPHEIEP